MGTREPVPKPAGRRHGHQKPEPVTTIPAGTWQETSDGRLVHYPAAALPCVIRKRFVDILITADPDED